MGLGYLSRTLCSLNATYQEYKIEVQRVLRTCIENQKHNLQKQLTQAVTLQVTMGEIARREAET